MEVKLNIDTNKLAEGMNAFNQNLALRPDKDLKSDISVTARDDIRQDWNISLLNLSSY